MVSFPDNIIVAAANGAPNDRPPTAISKSFDLYSVFAANSHSLIMDTSSFNKVVQKQNYLRYHHLNFWSKKNGMFHDDISNNCVPLLP